MKITAIEIRQHTFDKGLRGYKTEEVDAFLVSLSQEWERVIGDYKMLKMQLEMSEKELGKLKEVEMTLFRTLKTAEDTSTQITDQATKAGDQYLHEAKQKADDILADARKRSALMVQDAENQARYLKDNILNDLKTMEYDFKALETYKENLAMQIRALASGAVDSVDRFEKKFAKQNLKGKIDEVATQITDDINRENEQNSLSVDTPTELTVSDTAVELPPLIEREESIPEAIPTDEPLLAELDHAIEQSAHENSVPAPTADITNAETSEETSLLEQPDASAVQTESNEVQTEVVETGDDVKKKSGSFFDQI
ncbi:DivIVA domain-containing protein [Spirosoma utsteinense]|uniref:Cell division initiation protein n=1 Tax=Spirosoma utsteinense TaxID=2585773 RepID=A0ABR6W4Z8_9BACT|nr:DivIVA domain-containing protein [Spirosoma utsteinense]MBC3784361.1 cell division initiation protein [Spirosoma utsteinense]MBC3790840.1 cell division initiation protein [Spirosoma utsteinense]